MATFYVSRKIQHAILIDGCSGRDTHSRELRLQVAKLLKNYVTDDNFNPSDLFSYDLSLYLEKLDDDAHANIFEAYLNMI